MLKFKGKKKSFVVAAGIALTALTASCKVNGPVMVEEPVVPEIISIAVEGSLSKIQYLKDDQLNLDELTVKVFFDDETEKVVTDYTTDFESLTGINRTITVFYENFTAEVETKINRSIYAMHEAPVAAESQEGTFAGNENCDAVYYEFGDYPRTLKEENVQLSDTALENGLYIGSDGALYAGCIENAFENNWTYSDGVSLTGKLNAENPRQLFFKVEPLKWRLLLEEESTEGSHLAELEVSRKLLLLAEEIVDSGIPFYLTNSSRIIHELSIFANNYRFSTIRGWLNGIYDVYDVQDAAFSGNGFLQRAFTRDAQDRIIKTKNENTPHSTSDEEASLAIAYDYACADTEEKIFLLSQNEITRSTFGFSSKAGTRENSRIRCPTDYAIANYAYVNSANRAGPWNLRSPSKSGESKVAFVETDGRTDLNHDAANLHAGIVPALWVKAE